MSRPKSSSRIEIDSDQDFIFAPSSSEEEDWGDEAWEVEGIQDEHINTRGKLRFKVAWSGWKRDDGSNWTWETEDGTVMQDLSTVLKRWRKDQATERNFKADEPAIPPFTVTICESADEETKMRSKKSVLARYAFTEQATQAHQMAVDLVDEEDFEQSSSLALAHANLHALRAKRESALKELDVKLSDAPSQHLCGLGPAPDVQKEGRYQAQKKSSLHRRMQSLNVSKHIPKGDTNSNTTHHSMQVKSTLQSTTTSIVLTPREQRFKQPWVPDRAPRPLLPQRQAPGPPPQRAAERSWALLPPKPNSHPVPQFQPAAKPPSAALPLKQPALSVVPSSLSTAETRISSSLALSDAKRKRKLHSTSGVTPTPSPSIGHYIATPGRLNVVTRRASLQAKWSAIIQAAGAAPVTLVNEFNDEEIPALDINTFRYLESEYMFGVGVKRPEPDFMESCGCNAACTASWCTCQDDSEIQDEDGLKTMVYDANGLFNFDHNIQSYVIECNKNCLCDENCRSRVAQRPRKFPIEIFRTPKCGWGVRPTVDLPKGSVLGVYTGELITRETAKTFSVKRMSYLFDLDFMNSESQRGYSVDAYNCGNWTRFVNHSCNPICTLYPAIWDSVPSMHQPKLVFVTNTNVKAYQELTIDYCPQARKGKGKARAKIPGTPNCMCSAQECRGYIYLA